MLQRVHLVSFATLEFKRSQRRLTISAKRFGISNIHEFGPEDIDHAFYRRHSRILRSRRGAGYWLWKPYLIRKIMAQTIEGAIVFYMDADAEFVADPSPLIKLADGKGIVLFQNWIEHTNAIWTKRDCFIGMDCDSGVYWSATQLTAAYALFKNAARARSFVDEWLDYCASEPILTDQPNALGRANLPGFIEHRHDQSVLSLLALKSGMETFRDPSQFGNERKVPANRVAGEYMHHRSDYCDTVENSVYGQIVHSHGKRDVIALPIWGKIQGVLPTLVKRAVRSLLSQ
jgi:hypothetical protein